MKHLKAATKFLLITVAMVTSPLWLPPFVFIEVVVFPLYEELW